MAQFFGHSSFEVKIGIEGKNSLWGINLRVENLVQYIDRSFKHC